MVVPVIRQITIHFRTVYLAPNNIRADIDALNEFLNCKRYALMLVFIEYNIQDIIACIYLNHSGIVSTADRLNNRF